MSFLAQVYGQTNMSQPAYLNISLDTWGGNVHREPDGREKENGRLFAPFWS